MNSTRDENGLLQPNLTRFPSGLTALGDWLHDNGFKFGIYSSAGELTCEKFPASLGHETEDAS